MDKIVKILVLFVSLISSYNLKADYVNTYVNYTNKPIWLYVRYNIGSGNDCRIEPGMAVNFYHSEARGLERVTLCLIGNPPGTQRDLLDKPDAMGGGYYYGDSVAYIRSFNDNSYDVDFYFSPNRYRIYKNTICKGWYMTTNNEGWGGLRRNLKLQPDINR